jgi:hypothetical protein
MDNMMCLIYEVRPLTCRSFGVTRDNADVCPRMPGRGETITQRVYIKSPQLRNQVESWKQECKQANLTWVERGLIPSVLFRAARPARFKELVDQNRIATAKLVSVDFDTELMWQPQVDAIRTGMLPELALQRR